VPLKRRAAPRAETMLWDGSKWQKALAESSTHPNLRAGIFEGTAQARVLSPGDDFSSQNALFPIPQGMLYNDGTGKWDRWRNNTEKTVLPSGTRTASGNSADQTNFNARGVIVVIDITAVSGTFAAGEGLSISIRGKDPSSGKYFVLLTDIGPYTAPGTYCMMVYPGATDAGAKITSENDIPLPRTWRVEYYISGTNPSFTFSVGASYIV